MPIRQHEKEAVKCGLVWGLRKRQDSALTAKKKKSRYDKGKRKGGNRGVEEGKKGK